MTNPDLCSSPNKSFFQRKVLLCIVVLGAVVLIAYTIALSLSFVGDDWIFYELAGRLSFADYLVKYFDPRVQTAWYRPVQGVLFRIGYDVFGTNQVGYHLVNVLFHFANAVALFLLVGRMTRWMIGFIAGLLFATFPIAVEGVFKAGVIDPVTALVFLLAIWFWLEYVQHGQWRDYVLAFIAFLVALLSKEIAVTLPVTLLLFDRFLIARPATVKTLVRRYTPFLFVWVVYLPLILVVTQRSVFVHHEGYTPSLHLFSNALDYAAGLAFPWGFNPPLSYVWLVLVTGTLLYLVLFRKLYALVPIVVGALLAYLPIVLFPLVSFRFLYVSLTGTAALFAVFLYGLWKRLPAIVPFRRPLLYVVLSIVVAVGNLQVSNAAADFSEYARVSRVTFRNFRQAHPTLPDDTLVYFVNPPLPGLNLSGMFFWYYGAHVTTRADDSNARAGLRDHAVAYVGYFGPDGSQKEQMVGKEMLSQLTPAPPFTFAAPIRLEGFELANSTVKRGDSILLFLYWRGLGRMETDYVVSARLSTPAGKVVATYAKSPRRGSAPTSTWAPGELVVDVVQIPVPAQAAPGAYQIEMELDDPATSKPMPIVDEGGQDIALKAVWQPLRVEP